MRSCSACGKESIDLEIHHILPKHLGGTDLKSNLIHICPRCHGLIHSSNRGDIKSLTKLGLQKAKESGITLGAPKGNTYRKGKKKRYDSNLITWIMDLRDEKKSFREIASHLKIYGNTDISWGTVRTIVKRFGHE